MKIKYFSIIPILITAAVADNGLILGTKILSKGAEIGYLHSWEKASFGVMGNYDIFSVDRIIDREGGMSQPPGTKVDVDYFAVGGKFIGGYIHKINSIDLNANSGIGFTYNRESESGLNAYESLNRVPELTLFVPFEIGFMVKQNDWLKYGLNFMYRSSYNLLGEGYGDVSVIDDEMFHIELRLELF
jgi:hypothetical protein